MRLDEYLVFKKLVASRNQAADLIRRKKVKLNGKLPDKPALQIKPSDKPRIQIQVEKLYASRGGYKLEAALKGLALNLKGKTVLDVGASAGGFSDVAVTAGAKQVVAVDVGRQALAASLRVIPHVLSFIQTDIRDFKWPAHLAKPDLITVDLSFISLTKVMASLLVFCQPQTQVLILAKPQFEVEGFDLQKGIVKNQAQRKLILQRLEVWLKENNWLVLAKRDAAIKGVKGNWEKFYLLKPVLPP